jgi:cell division protein FtsB
MRPPLLTWVHPPAAAKLVAASHDELDLAERTRQIRAMRDRAWIIPLGLLVITSVAVPLRLVEDMPRYLELGAQIARVTGSNAQLEREIQALSQETEVLRNDARAIERLARDELGMVREGEIVFQFPN